MNHDSDVGSLKVRYGLTLAVPAGAITNNWVEDNDHPFVGLIVFNDADGQFVQRCSGSLISPTKFLTAGSALVTLADRSSLVIPIQM